MKKVILILIPCFALLMSCGSPDKIYTQKQLDNVLDSAKKSTIDSIVNAEEMKLNYINYSDLIRQKKIPDGIVGPKTRIE